MGNPDLIRWLGVPGSFHFHMVCHVDLCVYIYSLVVKGTITSLVPSSTFTEEKGEAKGLSPSKSLSFYLQSTALAGQNRVTWPSLTAAIWNWVLLFFFLASAFSTVYRREKREGREMWMACGEPIMVFVTMCKHVIAILWLLIVLIPCQIVSNSSAVI